MLQEELVKSFRIGSTSAPACTRSNRCQFGLHTGQKKRGWIR